MFYNCFQFNSYYIYLLLLQGVGGRWGVSILSLSFFLFLLRGGRERVDDACELIGHHHEVHPHSIAEPRFVLFW